MATKSTTKKSSKTTAKKAKAPVKKSSPVKTATKNVAAKVSTSKTSTVKTTAPVKNQTPEVTQKVETKQPGQNPAGFKIKRSYVILVAAFILVGALLYYFRGVFVAAVVNGQPISRLEIIQEAEKQTGKQALNTQVRNLLIEQEARKQNVTVSEKEIDDEIKKVEGTLAQQGQKLDQVLQLQGMTKEDLRKLIKLDKLVGKMVGKEVKVTDKEVADYIEQNKEMLPQDQSEEQTKKSVAERLKQEKLNEKVKTWLENLQKNANTVYFVQY